jgi:hypothetical protein
MCVAQKQDPNPCRAPLLGDKVLAIPLLCSPEGIGVTQTIMLCLRLLLAGRSPYPFVGEGESLPPPVEELGFRAFEIYKRAVKNFNNERILFHFFFIEVNRE